MVEAYKNFVVLKELRVDVYSYNAEYFNNQREMIECQSLILSNYVESEMEDFLDFLKDSVENNPYLNDFIKEINFEINDIKNEISFKEDNEEYSYIFMGSYIVEKYKVFVSGSYIFIQDLSNYKKYMYYGD